MAESRKDKRAPAALRVKYKSANVDEFIEQAGLNISRGGIFVKTTKPMPLGVPLRLELQLSGGVPVIRGVGRVSWRRELGQSDEQPAGMGIKFIKLDPGARAVVERAVHERGGGPSRFDKLVGTEAVFVSVPPAAAEPEPAAPPPAPPIETAPAPTEQTPQGQQEHVGDFVASALSEGGAPPVLTEQTSSSWADALQKRAEVVARTPRKSEPSLSPQKPPLERASSSGSNSVDGLFGSVSSSERLMWTRTKGSGEAETRAIGSNSGLSSQSAVQGLFGSSSTSGRMPLPTKDKGVAVVPPPAVEQVAPPARVFRAPYSSRPPIETAVDLPFDPEANAFEPMAEEKTSAPAPDQGEDDRASADEAGWLGAVIPRKSAQLLTDLASESEGAQEAAARQASEADIETVSEATLPDFAGDAPPPGFSGPDRQTEPAGAESQPEPAPRRKDGATFPPDVPARRGSFGVFLMAVVALALLGAGGYLLYIKGALQMPSIGGLTADPEPVAQEAQPEENEQAQGEAATAEDEQPAPAEGESMTFGIAEVELSESEDEQPVADGEQPAAEGEAPDPEMAEVAFQSTPPGATVFLDEELTGKTPFKLGLKVGKPVSVSAISRGYKKATRRLVPETGQAPVQFEMEKLSYVLVVKTDPPGAKVTVENRSVTSPQPIDLGQLGRTVTVTLSKPGHRMIAIPVRRGQFEETEDAYFYETEMKLTPLPGVKPKSRKPPAVRSPRRRFRAAETAKKKAPKPPAPKEQTIPNNPF